MKGKLIFMVGQSGCGKDATANYMVNAYGWHKVASYTTRPKRKEEKQGDTHLFIKLGQVGGDPQFWAGWHKLTLFAWTVYGGHWYWTTREQLTNYAGDGKPIIYIIDEEGLESILTDRANNAWLRANFDWEVWKVERNGTQLVENERTVRDMTRKQEWFEKHIANSGATPDYNKRYSVIHNDYDLLYLYSTLDAIVKREYNINV